MAEPNHNSPSETDLSGTTLNNRYRVMEKIGHGGMGTVYRGVHIFMERPVAIKVLHPHLVTNHNFIQRFLHEARINSKLSHRNAVILYDFGVEGQAPYLVFEFVEGLTLREVLLKDGQLPLDRFINIVTQVGQALSHAHSLGIVHRDLKPDNIMIGHRDPAHEHACVLDFGIAKVLHQSSGQERTVVTQMGMVMGTPQYLSPEQALEKELDARSDIYSLGIIMYEMLTGEVPFKTPSSPLEILVQHLNSQPRPIRTLKPELDIPIGIADAVMKCLAKEREERFQSIAELLTALEGGRPAAAENVVPPPSQVEPKPEGPRLEGAIAESKAPKHLSPALYAIVLLLAVAGTAAYLFRVQQDEPALASKKAEPEPAPAKLEKPADNPPPAVAISQQPEAPKAIAQPELKQLPVVPPAIQPVADLPVQTALQPTIDSVIPGEELFGVFSLSRISLLETAEFLNEFPAEVKIEERILQDLNPELAALVSDDIAVTSSTPPLSASQFEAKFNAAKKLSQQKDYLAAAKEYQTLLRSRGTHLNARLSLGTAYLKLGAYEAALREFNRVLEIEPEFAPAVYMLAAYYAVKNQPESALLELSRALKLFPGVRKWLPEDREFDSLRDTEQMQKLLASK